jgi:hypothetical protein
MRHFSTVACFGALTVLSMLGARHAQAMTYNLPLDGSVSIVDNGTPSAPIAIEVQAIENFSLPVFNQQNPLATVGVYQWIANFSVFNQNGSQVSEPTLSPFGTALTGYGQNCSVAPFCPEPSGPSSETILSGTLLISGNSTLDISTICSGINVLSSNLELSLTVPAGASVSTTPLPAALPLFGTGLGFLGILGWCKRRNVASLLQNSAFARRAPKDAP